MRRRKRWTIADARRAARNADRDSRQWEAEKAQVQLLHTLAFADEIIDDAAKKSKRWPAARRRTKMRDARRHAAECIRSATHLANNPTQLPTFLTGRALEEAIRIDTGLASSLPLAGVQLGVTNGHVREIGSMHYWGVDERAETITLRGRAGGILLHVVVAGAERELYAEALAMLVTAADRRGL